jgi:hypothetical protein
LGFGSESGRASRCDRILPLVTSDVRDPLTRWLTKRRLAWPLALLLLAIQTGLLVTTALDKSDTIDEPTYMERAAALHKAPRGELPGGWILPQWAWAAALEIAAPAVDPPDGKRFLYFSVGVLDDYPGGRRVALVATRIMTVCATVLGGVFLWLAARRLGEGPAVVALCLWCLSPSVLANGCLVNANGWLAACMCFLLWASARFLGRPGRLGAGVVGIAFAFAAATKAPALIALPVIVAGGAWAAREVSRHDGRRAARLAIEWGGAFALGFGLALWAAFGFTVGVVRAEVLGAYGVDATSTWGPLPSPVWFETLLTQFAYGALGKKGYLLGETRIEGWWWFYFVVLAVKLTIAAQLLGLLRVVQMVKLRACRSSLLLDAALLGYPLLLFAAMSGGKASAGIRYLLPAFPFVMVWAGRAVAQAGAILGRAGVPVVLTVMALGAVETALIHPHHLMFFNLWAGGPENGPRILIYGDDWGQDQRRLGEWQARNQIPLIYYAKYHGRPEAWGISAKEVPCTPRKGVFALQAEEIYRHGAYPAGCLDWLTVEAPDERIGYSIYIYVVDKVRLERLKRLRYSNRPFFRSGPPPMP